MNIIRYADPQGQIHYAAEQADGSAMQIDGDIFGEYRVTSFRAHMAKILAPVVPTAILCIGLNYKKHAEETKAKIPQWPVLFMKSPAAVQNPNDPIVLPTKLKSTQVDYECELAVVIGKACKNVSKERALDYVLGYTCGNDVSARDWQKEKRLGGGQFARGKSFDGFCPLGPAIVTRDEVPNPNALRIKCTLNGQVMQDHTTSDMIFDVPALIESLSSTMTLRPGSVILTGTPHGVGFARTPPVWMKAGDTVVIELERIGRLENPVGTEP